MATSSSRIQSELRQTRPFPSREQECVVGLLRTADVVRRRLASVIESQGLTLQQYNVLRILRGAGTDGLPTLDIVSRLIEEAPGITRLLDRLERGGFVRRQRCPHDRRQVLCFISDAGLERLSALDAPLARTDRTALGELGARRLEALIRLLDAVRAGSRSGPADRGTDQDKTRTRAARTTPPRKKKEKTR